MEEDKPKIDNTEITAEGNKNLESEANRKLSANANLFVPKRSPEIPKILNPEAKAFIPPTSEGESGSEEYEYEEYPPPADLGPLPPPMYMYPPPPPAYFPDQADPQDDNYNTLDHVDPPLDSLHNEPNSNGEQVAHQLEYDPEHQGENNYSPLGGDRKTSLLNDKSPPFLPKRMSTPPIPKRRYEIAVLLNYREKFRMRPYHMKEINIPLQQSEWVKSKTSKIDYYNESVGELRIQLNKITPENFTIISDKIIYQFSYNGRLLAEFAKLLFNKSVKEPLYIDMYMKLYDQMHSIYSYKKLAPYNIDFRKMFIDHCQRTFEDMESENLFKNAPKDMDETEKHYKKRQRILGNIKLIGELYIRGALPEKVVIACIDSLFVEINEEKIENLCQLLLKLGKPLYEYYAYREGYSTRKMNHPIKAKSFQQPKFDSIVDKLVEMKGNNELITSRVRFMIQDVQEAREKDWNLVFGTKKRAMYREKVPNIPEGQNIQEIAGSEVNEDSKEIEETDEMYMERQLRKKSTNESNTLGRNLDLYQQIKSDEKMRLKIFNWIFEFLTHLNTLVAFKAISDICEETKKPKEIIMGHILLVSFAKSNTEFKEILNLLLYIHKEKLFTQAHIIDGIYVCLGNIYDSLIDYPMTGDLFGDFVEALKEENILNAELGRRLKGHVNQVQLKIDEEYDLLALEDPSDEEDEEETLASQKADKLGEAGEAKTGEEKDSKGGEVKKQPEQSICTLYRYSPRLIFMLLLIIN